MPTNTAGSSARELGFQAIHYLRKTIGYGDQGDGALTVGTLPAGAIILPNISGFVVTTAFNGTGTVLDIGDDSDTDEFATDLATGTAGLIEIDVETDVGPLAADTVVTATLAGTGASAGSGEVIIAFIPDNDK